MNTDLRFMRLALKEARKGVGRTSPNPAVGAVIVKNKEVVGKGFHPRAGAPHAEVNALAKAGPKARGATLYVTLEPCNHEGRTPPCTRAIITSGIKRVVTGMADPNPHVAGGGNRFLASQGVMVTAGVLEAECRAINRPFIKHCATGRPWVIMKAGMSLDGRIATRTGYSNWITNDLSRQQTHRLRGQVDAILIGIETALQDDPSLTTRINGKKGKDPLRVILDQHLRLPATAKMLRQQSTSRTLVFCGPKAPARQRKVLEAAGAVIQTVGAAGKLDLDEILAALGEMDIQSLLVEGGGRIHGSFLQAGLVDEVWLFIAPILIGEGVPVVDGLGIDTIQDALRLQEVSFKRFGDDLLVRGLTATATSGD